VEVNVGGIALTSQRGTDYPRRMIRTFALLTLARGSRAQTPPLSARVMALQATVTVQAPLVDITFGREGGVRKIKLVLTGSLRTSVCFGVAVPWTVVRAALVFLVEIARVLIGPATRDDIATALNEPFPETMKLLLTANLHFLLHRFRWLLEQAHEVRSLTRLLADVVPVAVCSGNHDNANLSRITGVSV
jgi:hypothetical protein